MKVNQTQLENLLELAATDLLILRSKNAIEELKRNPEHSEISQRLRASSASFLEANNKVETLQLELRRLETDVDLVEKRIAKILELRHKDRHPSDRTHLLRIGGKP